MLAAGEKVYVDDLIAASIPGLKVHKQLVNASGLLEIV
jgi:hypothetical protein